MGAETLVQSSSSPGQHELDKALDDIGVTASHKKIIFLIMLGVMFDVFEQNAVGLVGPLLREQWGISVPQIALQALLQSFPTGLGTALDTAMWLLGADSLNVALDAAFAADAAIFLYRWGVGNIKLVASA